MKKVRVHEVVKLPHAVVVIDSAALLPEAVSRMRAQRIHHLVVLDKGEQVGVLSYRDIVDRGLLTDAFILNGSSCVADVMHECTATVTDETTIREALQSMTRERCSALPVVVDGKMVGIVTEGDLLQILGRLLDDDPSLEAASREGRIVMSNPVLQNAMHLLAEAGI